MPGMYPDGEYDVAGFAVGVVERSQIIDGSRVQVGDRLLGLASSGPHSNGYSLVRKVLEKALGEVSAQALQQPLEGRPLSEHVMAPTRIYVKSLLPLLRDAAQTHPRPGAHHGRRTGGECAAHAAEGVTAHMEASRWQRPPVFDWLQQQGGIDTAEMHRVFNCGIGMVLAVAPADVAAVTRALTEAGEQVFEIGEVRTRQPGEPRPWSPEGKGQGSSCQHGRPPRVPRVPTNGRPLFFVVAINFCIYRSRVIVMWPDRGGNFPSHVSLTAM